MLKKNSNAFPTADNELSEELIDEDQLEYIDQDLKFEDLNDCIEESYVCEPDDVVREVSEEELVDAEDFENPEPVESPKKNKRHFVLFQESRPVKRLRNFFICEECGGYFKKENEYKDHLEGHMERKESKQFYPCHECSLSFNTKSLLNLHRRNDHNGNGQFGGAEEAHTGLETPIHGQMQRMLLSSGESGIVLLFRLLGMLLVQQLGKRLCIEFLEHQFGGWWTCRPLTHKTVNFRL